MWGCHRNMDMVIVLVDDNQFSIPIVTQQKIEQKEYNKLY